LSAKRINGTAIDLRLFSHRYRLFLDSKLVFMQSICLETLIAETVFAVILQPIPLWIKTFLERIFYV